MTRRWWRSGIPGASILSIYWQARSGSRPRSTTWGGKESAFTFGEFSGHERTIPESEKSASVWGLLAREGLQKALPWLGRLWQVCPSSLAAEMTEIPALVS